VTVEAYPLHWPEGRPRTKRPTRAKFDTSFAIARDGLIKEIEMLGGKHIVLSTNVRLRRDSLPYATDRAPEDTGVAVYFERKGRLMSFPCDKWDRVKDNLQAVRKTINALRGIERWGSEQMMDQAFTGFVALEYQESDSWWIVLGVSQSSSKAEIKAAYKRKRSESHPDKDGGDKDQFHKVQLAYEEAMNN